MVMDSGPGVWLQRAVPDARVRILPDAEFENEFGVAGARAFPDEKLMVFRESMPSSCFLSSVS